MAPCSLDLVRCAASILLAAEQWRMVPTAATSMVLTYLDSYRAATRDPQPGEVAPASGHGAVWDLLAATASGTQVALLDRVTRRKRSGRRAIRDAWNRPRLGSSRAQGGARGDRRLPRSVDRPARLGSST